MRELKFRCFIDGRMDMSLAIKQIAMLGYEISDKVIFMQYTGLKDKNGVEIYDDDILEFEAPLFEKKASPNPKCIGTTKELALIRAICGGFILVRRFLWNDKRFNDAGDALADMQNKVWIQENCTVIGNIYENPELLEENK